MSERNWWWWVRRPEDASPELFWLYLVGSWLLAGFSLWSYSRRGELLDLVMSACFFGMGLHGLWVLRRRRSRPEG